MELLVCDVIFLSLPWWDSDQYCGDIIATLSALCPAIYIKLKKSLLQLFAELIYSFLAKKHVLEFFNSHIIYFCYMQ